MKTMKYCKNDEYLTPPEAVYPVMKRLKARAAVWCPFDTEESAYVKVLSEHGFFCPLRAHTDGTGLFSDRGAGL